MTAITAATDVDLDHHYRIHTGGTDPIELLTIGHTDRWSVHYLGRITARGRRVWLLYDPGQIKGLIVLVPSPADPLVQWLCAGGWHQVAALSNRQVLVRRRPPQHLNSTGPAQTAPGPARDRPKARLPIPGPAPAPAPDRTERWAGTAAEG